MRIPNFGGNLPDRDSSDILGEFKPFVEPGDRRLSGAAAGRQPPSRM
jgi:hypothetical protein